MEVMSRPCHYYCLKRVISGRKEENDFWVWFDYRDQKIFSRKISATKYSDLVGLTEGNDFFRSNVAALAFVHGQLKVRKYSKLQVLIKVISLRKGY